MVPPGLRGCFNRSRVSYFRFASTSNSTLARAVKRRARATNRFCSTTVTRDAGPLRNRAAIRNPLPTVVGRTLRATRINAVMVSSCAGPVQGRRRGSPAMPARRAHAGAGRDRPVQREGCSASWAAPAHSPSHQNCNSTPTVVMRPHHGHCHRELVRLPRTIARCRDSCTPCTSARPAVGSARCSGTRTRRYSRIRRP